MKLNEAAYQPITRAGVQHLLVTKTGADPEMFEGNGNCSLEELGLDSLAVLQLSSVLESSYGLTIPDEAISMTVGEIVQYANASARAA